MAANHLIRKEDGAAAVEFALIATPFLSLLAVILQTALLVWTARNLDDALQRAGRKIYTGQFQKANTGQTDSSKLLSAMKASMCGTNTAQVATAFDCSSLKLNIALSTSFAAGSVPTPLDTMTKDWSSGFGNSYACAQPGAIVVFTAAVKYRVAFSFLYAGLPGFGDGARLLQSTAVFRTEPYDTSSGQGC
ncbi:TadE/TadG family type IV pilus assembly protein [Methylobacterium mesophilicum]|uniref:TadE/TadG family type IV pilus assembly protein n=1 Tax=Methylobacterium mesophilicum TaxID=39956 RepID=UPI001FCE973E|nr:TadE/TadG family type IV pilus assembly protein [Methylobacterium mesophilicum]